MLYWGRCAGHASRVMIGGRSMKRRVLSFFIALALCLSLCPTWGFAVVYELINNKTDANSYTVSAERTFDAGTYTYTVSGNTAIIVMNTGILTLKGHAVTSQNGAGVEVQSGGSLIVNDPKLTVTGTTYGLDVASAGEKKVKLSGGTFTGDTAAIHVGSGTFDDLLEEGYVFLDTSGNPITDMANAKTVVVKCQPQITWNTENFNPPEAVNYDGSPVAAGTDFPNVSITAPQDLSQHLEFYYKKQNDAAYTKGLPKDAGTYEIEARLPELAPNYCAASSDPLTLTINKINPIKEAPQKKTLTYNREPQELVTAGVLKDVAERDGVVIEYAKAEAGPYSTDIPAGITAGNYDVYYRVTGTNNYNDVLAKKIDNVRIELKTITPVVEVLPSSFVYDSTDKKSLINITVKDGTTELDSDQYNISWDNDLTKAGTHTVTVTSTNKNYTFAEKTAQVEIKKANQNALSIAGKPNVVRYGDTIITLGTTGGIGGGVVTWKSSDQAKAAINKTTGGLEIKDVGTFTVTAECTKANYETVSDTWTFTVQPKPVEAEVTVDPKEYDTTTNVVTTIKASVKTSDLVNSNDKVTISGLIGTYDNANAGTNKTVTLNSSSVTVSGADANKYTISYPATVKADINPKTVTPTVELSGNDLKTDTTTTPPTYFYNYDNTEKEPTVTVKDGSTVIPSSNYTVSYNNNKNVSTDSDKASVTVTAKAGGNYTFNAVKKEFTIKPAQAVLKQTPRAKDLTYDGTGQDLVDVGAADGGMVWYSSTGAADSYSETIPQGTNAGTYTVYYMVKGDGNHTDTAEAQVSVTIKPKEFTPVITLSQSSYTYNGAECKPSVTVKDGTVEIGKDVTDSSNNAEFTVSYSNNINVGTATVTVSDKNGGNYIVNGTAKFEITKAKAAFTTGKEPKAKTDLKYNGSAQPLVSAGESQDGTVVYSLDGSVYSTAIPTGINRGPYTVYAKVQGDSNHFDSDVSEYSVNIAAKFVTAPDVELSSTSFTYSGSEQKPNVTVRDSDRNVIPENEYQVEYGTGDGESTINVGEYTITITSTGPNYSFKEKVTRTVEILAVDQATLTITGKPSIVYYGDTIQLDTAGGSGNGTVTWKLMGHTKSEISAGGLLTVKDVNTPITVTATRSAGDNYNTISATWEFTAAKKPVTAVLTGVDRDYAAGNTTATVKAEVNASDLVSGDSIMIPNLSGTFEDANVGTNKTITFPTTPNPSVSGTNADKYEIIYPKTATASIKPVAATLSGVTGKTNLTYKAGEAQALVTAGTATGGTMFYSLDGTNFSRNVPMAQDAGTYTVYYKAQGDSNHTDSEVKSVSAEIKKKTVTPTVELKPSSAKYDGSVKQPTTVIVRDDAKHIIPDTEYKVTYDSGTNWKDKGEHKVKIENLDSGNYIINAAEGTFTIEESEQNPLEIVNKPGRVQFGDAPFTLSAVGGSGTGAITWESSDENVAGVDENNGLVTITGAGEVTITAEKAGGNADGPQNYNKSTATYTLTVERKPITAIVTADDKVFDNTTDATIHVTWENGALVGDDSIKLVGTFEDANAGIDKKVTITVTNDTTSQKYDITIPTVTATISKAEAVVPTLTANNRIYDDTIQPLVNGGDGNTLYSETEDGEYTATVPTGKDAGTYNVWYRIQETDNYTGIEAEEPIPVTIAPKTVSEPKITLSGVGIKQSDGIFYYESYSADTNLETAVTVAVADGEQPIPPDEYEVAYAPNSEENPTEITVTITDKANGNYTVSGSLIIIIGTAPAEVSPPVENNPPVVSGPSSSNTPTPSAPMQTSVSNGTASTVMSTAGGNKLVQEAVASQSKNVVIKPEITGDVTKTEVSIPASTVSKLSSQTSADLTVSTPVADVTIPNKALDTLSSAGGTVKAVTEQEDNSVTLTLSAGGKTVDSVPGGVTLTVPVEDDGPGTVAVLVREDGTRETIRKSVAGDGKIDIPLDGSATVEIVDNSKDFADVSDENWASDAVAFASAHELFNGTSETTFSPDQPMSRGMLATVLYNLEGQPDQDQSVTFSDVDSDAWYAAGVSWAAENGITNGYSDGQFAPDQSITREQFAVMLWRYAGSPAANGEALNFTDADKVSGYALEALCWAAENGILNGYGDGRLNPGGVATRAQAAQMLKNFLEKI